MATLEEEYQKYDTGNRTQSINDMYDAQKDAQLAGLEEAYNQNRQTAQTASDNVAKQYNQQANSLNKQYERNRMNFNEAAAASGINTGTGSQVRLVQNSSYLGNMGNLRTAQANAQTQADQNLANLEMQYKNAVRSAIAENDYARAQALMAEYDNQYARDMQRAQTLAGYGDFSGFAAIYGQEAANNMAALWKAQNPDLAWNTGAISAEEYKQLTGSYPQGYSAGGYGGYGNGGSIGETFDSLAEMGRRLTKGLTGTGKENGETPTERSAITMPVTPQRAEQYKNADAGIVPETDGIRGFDLTAPNLMLGTMSGGRNPIPTAMSADAVKKAYEAGTFSDAQVAEWAKSRGIK